MASRTTFCARIRRGRSRCRCKYHRSVPRASSNAAAVLLLHGDERFLVDETSRATLEAWKADLVSDFGFETLEGTGLNATRLLITVAGRLSPGNKLVKAVKAVRGTVQEMQHLKGRALSEWTTRRAVEAHGLTPAIAAQVVRVTPPDLSVIDSELSKLAAYKASGSKLTSDAVTELLAGGREDEIFKLTDNLLPHPTPQALQIARGLTRGGLQPTSVAYRMARHVALVLEVRARQERGESLQQVQDVMAEHRFVVQKAYDTAQNADPDRLEAALRAIRDYEWEVKSGQIDAELGLDVLLTRL